MLFNSLEFAVFFPLVCALYFTLGRRGQTVLLLVSSCVFYMAFVPVYILILGVTIAIDYVAGLWLEEATGPRRKAILLGSIVATCLVLFVFKYFAFFTGSFVGIAGLLGWKLSAPALHIILPIGLSFHTFQSLSYVVEVYRGHQKAERDFAIYATYVMFFPQLVAGPIVRAADFIPQLLAPYQLSRRDFGLAVFWILNGLMKKVVIGDYIALNFIDRVFDDPVRYSGFECLMALFAYSLQVYADFSGYTDIAIGVALLMGFKLATNFNSPYKAAHVGEFWKRWHMSLSTWLRDYLYIPLGGNRGATLGTWICAGLLLLVAVLLSGAFWLVPLAFSIVAACVVLVRYVPNMKEGITTNINLMMTMLLGGLWHGASWMFVIWGGLNGLALVFYKAWYKVSPWKNDKRWPVHAMAVALTLTFITFTRVWFRSPSLEIAGSMLHQIGNAFSPSVIPAVLIGFKSVFLLMLVGYVIHWLPATFKQRYRERFADLPLWAMGLVTVGTVFITYQFAAAGSVPFIYFQF